MDEKDKSILLVEDEAILAMNEKRELEEYGYNIQLVHNGEDAITASIDSDSAIDLILMDINLGPGIDGVQASEKILKHKNIPIIFLTSHTEKEIIEKTKNVNSYGFVIKNSGIDILDATIRNVLKLFKLQNFNTLICQNKSEMCKRILSFNWSNTAVGPITSWPSSLLTIVNIMIATQFPIAILWTKELILIFNDAYSEICGNKHPGALGHSTKEIWPEVWDINQPIFEAVMQRSETLHFEDKLFPINRHGYEEDAYFTLCYSPIYIEDSSINGTLVILHETTKQKQAEKMLQKNEEKYRSLFENMTQEVHFWELIRDEQGKIKTWRLIDINPAGLKGWNKTKIEVIGKTADEIFPDNNATEQFMPIVKKIFTENQPHMWESYFPGTNQHLLMTSIPLGDYFISTGIDISESLFIKNQLKEKELLLKEIHHRVKNNLANIESIISLQHNSHSNPEVQSVLVDVIGSIKSVWTLYDNLLVSDLYNEISVRNYITTLIDSITTLFPEKNHINIEQHISDFIMSAKNITSLGIIINELLTNIFKYSFKDKINNNIFISLEKNDNRAILIIHDNGVGIDNKVISNQSKGLGLTLVNMLAMQLEGSFSIEKIDGTKCVLEFKV